MFQKILEQTLHSLKRLDREKKKIPVESFLEETSPDSQELFCAVSRKMGGSIFSCKILYK